MHMLPLRLPPGTDLRAALGQALGPGGPADATAGFVLAGIGSLSVVRLRLAGTDTVFERQGDHELLSLSGSLSPDGPHLHASVADGQGRVIGGHLLAGNIVRTTAELLVALLPGWGFERQADAATGYAELRISRKG